MAVAHSPYSVSFCAPDHFWFLFLEASKQERKRKRERETEYMSLHHKFCNFGTLGIKLPTQ